MTPLASHSLVFRAQQHAKTVTLTNGSHATHSKSHLNVSNGGYTASSSIVYDHPNYRVLDQHAKHRGWKIVEGID